MPTDKKGNCLILNFCKMNNEQEMLELYKNWFNKMMNKTKKEIGCMNFIVGDGMRPQHHFH